MRELYNTMFAFEVDFEKMEGKYLFSTDKSLQDEAEEILLKECTYTHAVILKDREVGKRVIYKEEKVWGLALDDFIIPAADTTTTQLATKKGFICQVCARLWREAVAAGKQIYIFSDDGVKFPITIINTPEDVL